MITSSANALAQNDSGTAVELGHGALERFREGDYEAALNLFRRAESLAHSPVFALYVARCLLELGRFMEAKRAYETVVNEPLAERAPSSWIAAHESARLELEELGPRIPSVVVAASFDPTVFELDGQPRPLTELGMELELDPGFHRVTLEGSSGAVTRVFESKEGERGLRLVLDEPPALPRVATAPEAPPARATRPERPVARSGPTGAFLVPTVLGGVALAAGATAGMVAIVELSNLKARCEGNECQPSDASRATSIRRWATISTAAFGVAAAGLTVGAVLYFADSRSDRTAVGLHASGAF